MKIRFYLLKITNKDLFNHDKLNAFDGPLATYNSQDEGDSSYLQKIQAPKTLAVKVGCPVMLPLHNLSLNTMLQIF